MNFGCKKEQADYGGNPYVANVEHMGMKNTNFRTSIWTGCHMQMTLMCIPPCEDIGIEMHEYVDQFIRVEQGKATLIMGKCKNRMDIQQNICKGDVVFVPGGIWHNIINIGHEPLKLSSIYGPPNHCKGTVHHTKEEAELEDMYKM